MRPRRLTAWLLLALLAGTAAAGGARAQTAQSPLVAELSQDRIGITTGFAGTDIMVFGATDRPLGPGHDEVLIQVQGPAQALVVRRKVRVLGIWVNGPSARFLGVPGFYAVSGTRPLDEMLPEAQQRDARLGLDNLPLRSSASSDPSFREALAELKKAAGLWAEDASRIEIAGGRLFHGRIPLPATVAPGEYRVAVLLVRAGRIVARQELPMRVERVGTAASINGLAHQQGVVYGLLCVVLAAAAGWLGSILFRRG
jgi:uncharacterized protein (TIGR02186 family)